MSSFKGYFKRQLDLNTEALNFALLRMKHGTGPSDEVYELLSKRAVIKDEYIAELEATLAMLEYASEYNKAS
jgi:hypothetical protein